MLRLRSSTASSLTLACASSSTIGGLDVIRKEAWRFCRTSSSIRLCWELEEPKGPQGPHGAVQPVNQHAERVRYCKYQTLPSVKSPVLQDAREASLRSIESPDPGNLVERRGHRSFYRTSSGVRLCWELEEPKGPKVRGVVGACGGGRIH